MFTSYGKIVYDPNRGSMTRRTNWWCVAEVDREITRYYRWWIQTKYNPFQIEEWKVHPPAWDAHVSIIRGEQPPADKMHLWKKYHGQRMEIHYPSPSDYYIAGPTHSVGGLFFIVDVDCPDLIKIREEFGFKSDWKLHLSFGRMYE